MKHPSVCFHCGLSCQGSKISRRRFHDRTRRLGSRLDKVDVFGIAGGRFEVKLVEGEGRSAPEETRKPRGLSFVMLK